MLTCKSKQTINHDTRTITEERKMKKMICVLLALTMIFALCACGKTAAPAEKKTFIMGIDPE